MNKKFLIFLLLSIPKLLISQNDEKLKISMLNFNFSYHIPGGDLSKRFGPSSMIGFGFQKKNKNNLLYGLNIEAIAGSNVKENDILNIITADSLDIIDINGNTATIRFWQRGLNSSLFIGKVLALSDKNINSGIFIKTSFGFMYHKIRIEDIGNLAPQLNSELMKGYDKLCMGLSIGEMIGYIYFSKDKRKNFFIGLESIQGFTNDVRRYDYNKKKSYLDNRIDILTGIKFGCIFLIDRKNNNDKYYYY